MSERVFDRWNYIRILIGQTMSHSYKIVYQTKDFSERVRGMTLPIFIHNGSYFLDTLEIYEDGLVDCWELIALDDLPEKVNKNWVTVQAPKGARISIHDLGMATVKDADWLLTNQEFMELVQKALEQLNPNRQNITDLQRLKRKRAAESNIPESMIGVSRWRPNVYRFTEYGLEILGERFPIFYQQNEEVFLTSCITYQNETAQIGFDETIISIGKIREMLDNNIITTNVPDGTRLTISGLGDFQVLNGYWKVEKDELWKAIENKIAILNGQLDLVSVARQALKIYQENPNRDNHMNLKEAYEAVPKHHRKFIGDMDHKDHEVKRILARDLDSYDK
jgi:hypothetical protein